MAGTGTVKARVKQGKPDGKGKTEYLYLTKLKSNFEKMEQIKSGVSKLALVGMKNHINMDYDHLSAILGTSKTTLQKKKDDEIFDAAISEKILALSAIYEYGYEVFEDKERFEKWMQTENRALGYEMPINLLDTSFGIEEVKNVLGRLEYGVYS